jgi:hypothetical protein
LTSRSAMTPGKVLVIPLISRMGVMTQGSLIAAGESLPDHAM